MIESRTDFEALFAVQRNNELLERQVEELKQLYASAQRANQRLKFQADTLESLVDQELSRKSQVEMELRNLKSAVQKLTREMKELSEDAPRDIEVGGIPVDAHYILFVVDTSGSMQRIWPRVARELENVIEIHPKVKGFQILNDNGLYLFNSFRGRWIPDSKSVRSRTITALKTWSAISNSSPVEGITAAIRTFYNPDERMSIYVFGDEFTGDSIHNVLETVDRLNRKRADGRKMVRIHAVGFQTGMGLTSYRFTSLMRELAYRNEGTFIALP